MARHLRWFLILSSWISFLSFTVGAGAQTGVSDSRQAAGATRPVEIRAVWMDRGSIPKTEAGIRHLIRSYAKAGINLVHPEVIFNGYSAYPSAFLKQKDLWPGVDMLRVLTDEAHKNGIEIHPWVWVFRAGYTTDRGGILPQHPDWVMLDKFGNDHTENGSYWLSPCHEAVRRLLLRSYEELVQKYPVDGIELDYVRYPSTSFGYEPLCREKFKAQYGIDPLDIQPLTKPVVDWFSWRENLITSFVQDVATDLRKIKPKLKISAAVASHPSDARMQYLQNWQNWAANRWVDFVSPMDYTANSMNFAKAVIDTVTEIDSTALVASGIGLLEFKGADPMLQQVEIARDQNANGVTLFAGSYLDETRLKALATGPFRTKAELPVRNPVHAAQKLSNLAARKLKNPQSIDDLQEANTHLRDARSLVKYQEYRQKDIGTVIPASPPLIYIPEKVIPIPQVSVPNTMSAPMIDGKLDDPVWQTAGKISLAYTPTAGAAPQPTEVFLAHDAQNLYIAYRCHESRMGDIKAKITAHDGAVFYEDSVEFFLDPQGQGKTYYQFAMNSLGTKYEAQSYDTNYNPEWQGAASREADAWTAEISVPLSAVKVSMLSTWRGNFCRNRAVITDGPNAEGSCWSPTYGSFHTPERFGKLAFN